MKIILIILLASLSISAQDLNSSIIQSAQSHLGTRVGTGICRALINKVLQDNNATVRSTDTVPRGTIKPGDIFLTAGFYTIKHGLIKGELRGIPAHTAFVLEVLGNDQYQIIEQNTDRRKVTIGIIDLKLTNDTMDCGTWFLRPTYGNHDKSGKKLIKWQYSK